MKNYLKLKESENAVIVYDYRPGDGSEILSSLGSSSRISPADSLSLNSFAKNDEVAKNQDADVIYNNLHLAFERNQIHAGEEEKHQQPIEEEKEDAAAPENLDPE